MNTHEILRQRIYARAGLNNANTPVYDIEALRKSEWSEDFEAMMRNRLIIGAFRYGLIGDKTKKPWDRIAYIKTKLARYEQTGNLEALVDIANLSMLEFLEGNHPNKHFACLDDTQEHAKEK